MKSLALRLAALLATAVIHPSAGASEPPPGVIIHHSAAASGLYIGSPSICVAPDGSYLASHDLFGPKSDEHARARGRLYRSTDKGLTWKHLTDFDGFFWTGLFVHKQATYLMGTDKHHGNVVIRRSDDSGRTWTPPSIIATGQWHTAPMPAIEHAGRLWRAIEDAHTSQKWGERYRARMMSAPSDSDLADPKSWTISNALARDTAWLGGDFSAWLEGNAVAGPDGNIVDILRVDRSKLPEKAAIVRISKDGATASFDPEKDFVDFPGGAKKFTIRKDPAGPGYWSVASIIPDRHAPAGNPASIRNTLAFVHSEDLRRWEIRCVLLHHPDPVNHGFQYVDWQFEGEDIIAACRTAWDDEQGGAHNNHDANFLTFHRWKNFRRLTRADDVPMPESPTVTHETSKLIITGGAFQIAALKDGETAFSNRSYKWRSVPDALSGMSFTRLPGGAKPVLEVTAKMDTHISIATAIDQDPIDLTGWKPAGLDFRYDDPGNTRVHVRSRALKKGETLRLPAGNWSGAMLIFD